MATAAESDVEAGTVDDEKNCDRSIVADEQEGNTQTNTLTDAAKPFKIFTKETYARLLIKEQERREKRAVKKDADSEGRLVNGEIVFDDLEENTEKFTRDPKLADGQALPEMLGRFPKELTGVPLEEIDPYIEEKSFVVVAKKFRRYHIFRFSATYSLFCMTPWSPLRKFCVSVISNQWFDWLILLTITVNCGFMMVQPSNPTCVSYEPAEGGNYTSPHEICVKYVDYISQVPENIFQAVYTIEMLLKICARGWIVNKYTYLRDGWNWLDFIVVIIVYVTIILEESSEQGGSVNLTGLRAFRVLRALKSISVVPGLRTIVNALLKSLKMLGEVMLLTFFCIAVFALLALQLYMGLLKQKCVANIPNTYKFCNTTHPSPSNRSAVCFNSEHTFKTYWLQEKSNFLTGDDGEFVLCSSSEDKISGCPEGYFCAKAGDNPNWNFTQFDHFLWAMLNTFQLVSLDFWEDTYNMIIQVGGGWNLLFFLMVILVGSFYLLNLMLAVVFMAYQQEADVEAKRAKEEEEEERAKAKRKENTAMLFDPKKLKQQLMQRQHEEAAKELSRSNTLMADTAMLEATFPVNVTNMDTIAPVCNIINENRTVSVQPLAHPMVITELEGSSDSLREMGYGITNFDDGEDEFYDDLPAMDRKTERYLVQKFATLWLNRIRPDEDQLIDRNCICCAKTGLPSYHAWMRFQNMVFKVANDGLFELFITICIAVNTAIMASEYYDICELCRLCIPNVTCTLCHKSCNLEVDQQVEWVDGMTAAHSKAMNIANIVFTTLFTVEAIIKLAALSKEYFNVGWNIFDLVIVAFSLPDLLIFAMDLDAIAGLEEVAGIIKIFRLLRIVKLAQSWSTMRTLLGIIFGAFGALVNVSLILVIVMFIFAVLGNQLFGSAYAKYEDIVTYPELADFGGELPRWHFKTFFHSFLMVFRVLCGEWVEPLWDCMRVANQAGCTFLFLATLILGNFMILNLFLALLLNSFSTDKISQEKSGDQGEGKLKKSLRRMQHCFKSSSCWGNPQQSDKQSMRSEQEEMRPPSVTRLQAILGKRKSPITKNGSLKSVWSGLEGSEQKRDQLNTINPNYDAESVTDATSHASNGGLELKPLSMRNGHPNSQCGSITSTMSSATQEMSTEGVLGNRSDVMATYSRKHIESALSTQHHQFDKFGMAATVTAAAGGCYNPAAGGIIPSLIITHDVSSENGNSDNHNNSGGSKENRDQAIKDESDSTDEKADDSMELDSEGRASIVNEDGEEMQVEDGHIVLPDCLCAVCHRNEKLNGCCTATFTNFRMVCASIVTHKAFESFILLLIGASTIALCFEDIYLHENPNLVMALNYLNVLFALFFFIEMVLKMLALGLKKYFTGFWTILDFIIVCVSLTDIAGTYLSFADISAVRVMRTLRALRPLRAVSHWESMTIIVNALIFAMPAIANVLLVCIVFWLIFVILGVQTFRGRFHQCELNGIRVPAYPDTFDCGTMPIPDNLTGYRFPPSLTDCNSSILTPLLGDPNSGQWHWAKLCMVMGGTWKRPYIHFDHIGASYLALYQTATFEGWMEVMESAIDHNPMLGGQAHRELSLYWYLYFVIFIIFGAFFTLNLFIGVIIDNFNVLKKKYDGSYLAMFLTDNQRHYYNTLKKLGNKKPQKTIRRPKTRIQMLFFDIATSTKFEISITLVILVNMITMMIEYEPQTMYGSMSLEGEFIPDSVPAVDNALLSAMLEYINITFTGIFVIEACIKIGGLRLHYFRKAWNVFDFVVVFLSVISIILDQLLQENVFISPTLLRVVRVFRIGRVLRLVKEAKGIRKLLFALVISMPALFNIATLLFLFMFIFAIVGMTFFAHVKHRDALTNTVNFETFGRSILLLFRLCTSGGWNDVLYPLMEENDCNNTHYIDSLGVPQPSNGGDCSIQTLAVPFFLLYLFITFMVIINMYIAIILENFNQAHEQEEIGVTEDDFDMFYAIWEKYDPHATQYIKLGSLADYLDELAAPLGISKPNSMAIVTFNLPIVQGDRVHCLDVLMALVKKAIHNTEEDVSSMSEQHRDANERLKHQIDSKYKAAFPHREYAKVITTTLQRKKEDVAAKTLQRAWRKHKMKQNIHRIRELAWENTSMNRQSLSREVGGTFSNIRSRISSALSGISHRLHSPQTIKSIDSQKESVLPVPILAKQSELSPSTPEHQVHMDMSSSLGNEYGLSPPIRKYHSSSPEPNQPAYPRKVHDITAPSKQKVRDITPPSKQKVRDTTLPSKQKVRDITPPSKQKVRDITPPSKQKVRDISPPSKQKVCDITPPSTRKIRAITPPSKQKVRDITPPSTQSVRDISPLPIQRIRDISPPDT